ncbi:MAG: two-component system nitrogen regulation response regulator GlnG [Alteromonadaceae bacterium]|jgi:two-component system nitrogen regulation response regulator GlnG
MIKSSVWIIDDDDSIRWVLDKALSTDHIQVSCFEDGLALLAQLEVQAPDVIISDIRMPDIDGLSLLGKIHQLVEDLPVIIITAHSDLDTAVNAYQSGAFEYLPKPFDIDDVIEAVQKALDQVKEKKRANNTLPSIAPLQTDIIGEAPAMQEVFRAIGRLSRSSISVLINGQSGTGKELVAQALHKHSPRSDEPFIALNMAAIPKDLVESELFGHEKGAFTGANAVRQGRFTQADGGTLFLDEIGDMPIDVQTRLLRVLADGQFYRVGGHSPVAVDVRIIAATHQNLEELVQLGRFREDLFHRLNVVRIHLPSLTARKADIPKLIEYFLYRAAAELGVGAKMIAKEAVHFLASLPWPGNIRQLENTCRGLTVMASGNEIQLSDMPVELRTMQSPDGVITPNNQQNEQNEQNSNWQQLLKKSIECQFKSNQSNIIGDFMPQFERILITTALEQCGGKKQLAATRLGWGRNTLTRKLKELDI